MAKKSILYIITKSVWGGAARYVFDLASSLRAERSNPEITSSPSAPRNDNFFEVSVAAGGQGKFAQEIKRAGIPYFEITNFQRTINPFKDFFAFFEILGLLFKLKPDVIHVNSSKAGGLVGLAARLISRKSRLIFTAHGWAFNEDRPKWQISLIKLFTKLTALFYDKIICLSKYDFQFKIAPDDKLIFIYNGIDINKLNFYPKKEAQEKLMGKTSPLAIGTIAEWTKNKGLIYLLDVGHRVSHIDFVLIGSGENPDKEKMYQLAKQYPNIHLIEFIENAASYLKAFDIFVLPSLKEGLPYTILEAMAAQVPIVATKVGGIPEMIDDCGILIPLKNPEVIGKKILYLINNPKIAQSLTQKAYQKLAKEFTLAKMIQETKEIYSAFISAPVV